MRAVIWIAVSSLAQAADDKISLSEQRRACERYATDNDMQIIETLAIEGESRAAIDIVEFDSLPAAYHRLRQLWQDAAIDALVCYEFSRLGRSQSLLTYVLENCIRNGIDIHVVSGGTGIIDNSNYRGQIAIGGFAATSHMDSFRKKVRAARERKAALGLPVSGHVPFTHSIVRDDKGNAKRVIVKPDMRGFLDDLARLILERVSWERIPHELEALGHYDYEGKRYPHYTIYGAIHTPVFWGNQGIGYGNLSGNPGLWVFDATITAPDDVMIWYDTELTEPAYTGEIADAIQDELRRRTTGAARARGDKGIRMFTSLLICGECERAVQMRAHARDGRKYYGCKYAAIKNGNCENTRLIRTDTLQDSIEGIIRQAKNNSLETVLSATAPNHEDMIEKLSHEKSDIESQIKTLIRKQAAASDSIMAMYDDEIERLAQRLRAISQRRAELRQAAKIYKISAGQHHALDEIARLGDEFWSLPEADINQTLHRLFRNKRLLLLDGDIAGIGIVNI